MVKSTERVCYYQTLGLESNCSTEDVKKAYYAMSKIYHPDKYNSKCGMSKDEAAAKFLEVKKAYDILIEPDQRAIFDSYRQTYAVPEVFNPDLQVPFDNTNFNGYTDSGRGFYKIYSDVFDWIYANERAFQKKKNLPWNSVHKPPGMGNLDSPYPEVVRFYNYWLNFGSIMDFCWEDPHDEYDLSQVSRRGVKLWSRRNMKARKKAKKVYNNKVRGLAQNAKRLDKRVRQMTAKREEERKREVGEERERRKRLKKDKLEKTAIEYEEPEWTKPVERRRKYGDPEQEKEKEREEWECVVCRKGFRSEQQCRNHEQSKKHLRIVAELVELTEEEEGDSEELDEEEVLEEEKRDELVGESDEFCDGVDDNQRERVEVDDDDDDEEEEEEEVEEEEDEMDVLEAMVARRRTLEKVGAQVFEPAVEPMATTSHVENEVAIKHDQLHKTNKNGGERKLRRRRRVTSTGSKYQHDDNSNIKEFTSDYSVEKGDDDDEQIKKQNGGGRKERRSKKSKSKDKRDNEQKKIRNGGWREEKKGKKSNATSDFSAENENHGKGDDIDTKRNVKKLESNKLKNSCVRIHAT